MVWNFYTTRLESYYIFTGPNNQLLQALAVATLARYSNLTFMAPSIKDHRFNRQSKGNLTYHSFSEMVNMDLLSAFVGVSRRNVDLESATPRTKVKIIINLKRHAKKQADPTLANLSLNSRSEVIFIF